jgi:hypothetical protein
MASAVVNRGEVMGREVRMVPPNWEHPRKESGEYHPLHDQDFEERAAEWFAECVQWSKGEHADQKDESENWRKAYKYYWQWAGDPPDKEYYRPKWADGEATWFQVYETVSEGTPVTPPFATKAELVEYLATKGDFWSQQRGTGPWDRESATQFVGDGWAPSAIGMPGNGLKTVDQAGFYPQR